MEYDRPVPKNRDRNLYKFPPLCPLPQYLDKEEGKLIGLEVLDATERYTLSDIFNISTENLILEEKLIKQAS